MKLSLYAAIACSLVIYSTPSQAFEFATHAMLTREAFLLSTIGDKNSPQLAALGVAQKFDELGSYYIDMAPTGDVARVSMPRDYEDFAFRKIRDANQISPTGFTPTLHSIAGWMMQGAVREDDVVFDSWAIENTPQDDPAGNINRVLNHFLIQCSICRLSM